MKEEEISFRLKMESCDSVWKRITVILKNMRVLLWDCPANVPGDLTFTMNDAMHVMAGISFFFEITGFDDFKSIAATRFLMSTTVYGVGGGDPALVPAKGNKDSIFNQSHEKRDQCFQSMIGVLNI
jgi:hypothetical protein